MADQTVDAATPPVAAKAAAAEDLQAQITALQQQLSELAGTKGSKKSGGKYLPKTPLGMRDYHPEEMAVRELVFSTIQDVFKRHGAVAIETPAMELKETLTGKYGEDSKLIYDLADQGGEKLALRYDLTVPFARYCAEHGVEQLKRYHIARVYRRDNPVMTKGRYREFYQCDVDIAGEYEPMVPDAECIKIVTEVLDRLQIGEYVIKVNHRKLLDGIFKVAGVPEELFRPICSAVDKLDKQPWEEVKAEMVTKGIDEETAERIWGFVQQSGGSELVDTLLATPLGDDEGARQGLEDMGLMFKYLAAMGAPEQRISFDLSLARGLDYYTGVICEGVMTGANVGSIMGGGRYDNLVGMFLEAKAGKRKAKAGKAARKIPCVGVSLGIERLFTIVEQQRKSSIAAKPTEVLVAGIVSAEDKMAIMEERLKLCGDLWAAGVKAETMYKSNVKVMSQVQRCEKDLTPIMAIVGKGEMEAGIVKLRNVATREEVEVPRAEWVAKVKEMLPAAVEATAAAAAAAAAEAAEGASSK